MCVMNHCEPWILSSTVEILTVVDLSGNECTGISYVGNESLSALDSLQHSSCSLLVDLPVDVQELDKWEISHCEHWILSSNRSSSLCG